MGNATAKDIAKKLGLSPATVSVALNGKPGVSQATRERVLAAAAELGSQPHLHFAMYQDGNPITPHDYLPEK